MFPFGYGLSYTSFGYSDLQVSQPTPEGNFTVSCTVKNIGKRDGAEIIQVYVSDTASALPRPVKELKGYAKVWLQAGESKVARIDLDREALGFYDNRRSCWIAEAGDFVVHACASSADIRLSTSIVLAKTLTWTGL